jgi:hypothetical protein
MKPESPRFRLKRDPKGSPNQIGYFRPFIDALYLEPGGAWIVRGADEGTGEATVDLQQATPLLTESKAPHSFNPGGTLLIIDVSELDVLTVKIDESLIAGAR